MVDRQYEKKATVILLADDDTDDQELLKEAFSKTEPAAQIHTVVFGKEVFTYLENCEDGQLPNLIILDYNMPDCNGAEVLDGLAKNPRFRNIPAVIWSTSNASFYREVCKKFGARDYFYKPHLFDDIVRVSARMLEYV